MRNERVESRRLFSIYLPTSLYEKILNKAGKGSINSFVRGALEEKLSQEQDRKEEFKKKLISDYQSVAESKKAQKEVEIWDETLNDAWNTEDSKRTKKDE